MKYFKCILVLIVLFFFYKTMNQRKEPFALKNDHANPEKAGSIRRHNSPEDYSYLLLDMQTLGKCSLTKRNISKHLTHVKPNPEKAGSLPHRLTNYTDGIEIVSNLPSIDRDDFNRFPVYKHKKRKFPPIEQTKYYPYESILKPKLKKNSEPKPANLRE
jgi:hypothetical protein